MVLCANVHHLSGLTSCVAFEILPQSLSNYSKWSKYRHIITKVTIRTIWPLTAVCKWVNERERDQVAIFEWRHTSAVFMKRCSDNQRDATTQTHFNMQRQTERRNQSLYCLCLTLSCVCNNVTNVYVSVFVVKHWYQTLLCNMMIFKWQTVCRGHLHGNVWE